MSKPKEIEFLDAVQKLLTPIFDKAVTARDSAQEVISQITELRKVINRLEINILREANKELHQ